MPTTLNMIGTHYWGRTEPHLDGSYITTEWLTLLIPIIPMKSMRLRSLGKSSMNSEKFEVLEEFASLYAKQVRHVYKGVAIFLLAFAIALVLLINIGFVHNNGLGVLVFLAIFLVSYFIFLFWVDRYK